MGMKIYTKSGDKGKTSLYTGDRIAKNDPVIEAIGSVDECNSAVGVALAHIPLKKEFDHVREQLTRVQHALFDVGAAVATPRTRASTSKIEKTRFDEEGTEQLEKWIDEMEKELPVLHTFILPGGHPAGAHLHLARSLCRRAERTVVPLNQHADVSDHVFVYLNRLSDYLFVMSRHVNRLLDSPETKWEHHKS